MKETTSVSTGPLCGSIRSIEARRCETSLKSKELCEKNNIMINIIIII